MFIFWLKYYVVRSITTYYSSNVTYFSFRVSEIRPRGRILLTAAVDIINCVRVQDLCTCHAEYEAYLCTATLDRIYKAVATAIQSVTFVSAYLKLTQLSYKTLNANT